MSETHGLPFSKEQQIRQDVVLKLLDKGTRPRDIESLTDKIVEYILNGKKENPKAIQKIKVFLPDQEVDAQAYLLENGSLTVEFQNPELTEALFANLDLYGLSFQYAVDTSKDK